MKINNGNMTGKKEINIFFSIRFLFLQRNFFLCNNNFLIIKNRSVLSDFVINYLNKTVKIKSEEKQQSMSLGQILFPNFQTFLKIRK